MAELAFVDCEVPVENVLGKEGAGTAIFTASTEWERICILASHLGVMQRLLETCVKYAGERKQVRPGYRQIRSGCEQGSGNGHPPGNGPIRAV
jgi:alkylation response protein AidB-like acyl-CoA dehydrogenase